jgi:hypothetical protein
MLLVRPPSGHDDDDYLTIKSGCHHKLLLLDVESLLIAFVFTYPVFDKLPIPYCTETLWTTST